MRIEEEKRKIHNTRQNKDLEGAKSSYREKAISLINNYY